MDFDQALIAVDDQKILAVKINDVNDKLMVYLEDDTSPKLVEKIKTYRAMLLPCVKVKFICADAECIKSSWRGAAHWTVTFSSTVPTTTPHTNAMPSGFMSTSEALLHAQLAEMKSRYEYDKKLLEFKEKNAVKPSTADELFKYMPMLGLFMEIDDKKIQQMMGLYQISAGMQGNGTPTQQTGISGPIKTHLEKKGTPEEDKAAEDLIEQLDDLADKVPVSDLLILIKKLNEKPELVATLKAMAVAP